jgi:hypothetical protein
LRSAGSRLVKMEWGESHSTTYAQCTSQHAMRNGRGRLQAWLANVTEAWQTGAQHTQDRSAMHTGMHKMRDSSRHQRERCHGCGLRSCDGARHCFPCQIVVRCLRTASADRSRPYTGKHGPAGSEGHIFRVEVRTDGNIEDVALDGQQNGSLGRPRAVVAATSTRAESSDCPVNCSDCSSSHQLSVCHHVMRVTLQAPRR